MKTVYFKTESVERIQGLSSVSCQGWYTGSASGGSRGVVLGHRTFTGGLYYIYICSASPSYEATDVTAMRIAISGTRRTSDATVGQSHARFTDMNGATRCGD